MNALGSFQFQSISAQVCTTVYLLHVSTTLPTITSAMIESASIKQVSKSVYKSGILCELLLLLHAEAV